MKTINAMTKILLSPFEDIYSIASVMNKYEQAVKIMMK